VIWEKTEITLTGKVKIDDEIRKNAFKIFGEEIDDDKLAHLMLFAYFNPKIPFNNQLEKESGEWEGICSFKDKFKDLELRTSRTS